MHELGVGMRRWEGHHLSCRSHGESPLVCTQDSVCVANDGECGFTVGHIRDPNTQDAKHKRRRRGREGVLARACHSLSLAMQQELTQPSWPFIRVTQAPRFRNSPVWTFQIFMFLSQELVHKKWPLKVKQQSEMALECALKHRWGAC